MTYSVYLKNPETGEYGDLVQWERPCFTRDMYKTIASELLFHAGGASGWGNALAIVHRGGFDFDRANRGDADLTFSLVRDGSGAVIYANDVPVRTVGTI